MFSWFKKKPKPAPPTPPLSPPPPQADQARNERYPRMGNKVKIAFANAQRQWEESADLVAILARVLAENGHPTAPHDDGLLHIASQIVLQPVLCGFQPQEPSGISTATVIDTRHPAFGAQRIFEYQHTTGDDLEKSLAKGFDQWMQLDLPVLLEALRPKLENCMAMEMTFPAAGDQPERHRRAVLGPVAHLLKKQPAASECGGKIAEGEHDFCPCCLLTNSFEAFKPMMESDDFCAIRFFAMRDPDGQSQADCRVNGEDYEAGKVALLKYIEKWPQAGFEFRKQYVVLQNMPA